MDDDWIEEEDRFPILIQQDLSGIQEIIIEETPEAEDILESPLLTPAGPVEDPVQEYDCDDYDQDQFEGWDEDDINEDTVWAETLERISMIVPLVHVLHHPSRNGIHFR